MAEMHEKKINNLKRGLTKIKGCHLSSRRDEIEKKNNSINTM
jgi:hypothetical protein